MHNYVLLIGRIARDIEVYQRAEGKRVSTICLAVNKPFKNPETNTYDTDFIKVTLWDTMANVAEENCKKGDLIGIKGRLSTRLETLANGVSVNAIEVIGEKVIFLQSKKNNKQE